MCLFHVSSASLDSSESVSQAVLNLSDLESLRAILSTNPAIILDGSNAAFVSDIKATTGIIALLVISPLFATALNVFFLILNMSLNLWCVVLMFLHIVCYPNGNGFQCRCEENLAWSYNNCISYGVCDAIIGDMCGCLNSLPADGQYCQTISTPPGMPDWLAAKEFNILFLFQ